ncbi:MAG: hypothetical protein E7338_06155 [Clostridiales bacterium]|nr:hypothetical protein [Clostridiales bacterium]
MGKSAQIDESIEFLQGVQKDVQSRLHIFNKPQIGSLPNYLAFSKLPNIELFKPSLDAELEEKDITDEERESQAKAEQEAKEKAEAEAKAQEEARIAAEEEAARIAKEEEEARIKAEEEARLAEEEAARIAQEEEIKRKAEEEQAAKIAAEEEARRKAEEEEAARIAKEEEEARIKAEEEARIQAEQAEAAKLEQERIEKEAQEVEDIQENEVVEEEPQEKAEVKVEEVKKVEAPIQSKDSTPSSNVINFETLRNKKKVVLAKKSTMIAGGVQAAIQENAKKKEEQALIKKEEAQERAAKRREEQEKEELSRLPNAILIGNTKKASPELGKFEIGRSEDPEKPYKFILKTEKGKVVFETAPMKTKPNELTAVMFKDIMANGSFAFMRTDRGFIFKILDARQRVFCTSKSYPTTLDAQKAAALIKKYGLSANYIDDTTI